MRAALAAPDQSTATASPQQPQGQPQQQPDTQPSSPQDLEAQASTDVSGGLPALGTAAVGAARDALQNSWDTTFGALKPVAQWADKHGLNVAGLPVPKDGEKFAQLPEVERADESQSGGALINGTRDVGRFILGFMGAGMALKGLGMAGGMAANVAAGGIGDFLVSDVHDNRLIDFLTEYPALKDSFLGALADAGKGEDFSWQRKLEVAAEGVLTGGAVEGVIKLAGFLRKAIVAQKSGDPELIKKVLADAEPDLQDAYQRTIDAYHGSPHDFSEFDLAKMGSGEGSQAFGHGHYVAENPEVAEHYQALGAMREEHRDNAEYWAKIALEKNGGDPKAAAVWAREGADSAQTAFQSARFHNAAELLDGGWKPGAHLYDVKVKAGPDQLLDWDKPLSAQSETVQKALLPLVEKYEPALLTNGKLNAIESGDGLYQALAAHLGSEEAASKALNEAGIPGHRFLDQGSRGGLERNARDIAEIKDSFEGFDKRIATLREEIDANKNNKGLLPRFFDSREQEIKLLEAQKAERVQKLGELESESNLTRNIVVYHDDHLEITAKNGEPVTIKTDGEGFEHPTNGHTPLPLSDTAKAEIKAATEGGKDVKFEALSPETQAEVKDWIAKNPDALPPPPPPKYEPSFKLDDAQKAEFDKALDLSLSVPYATLKAEAPGMALEDTLGKYLNYAKMTGPDEMKLSLFKLAEMMAPKIDAAGGGAVQTFAHVTELADWIGTKPDVLMGTLKQFAGPGVDMPALVRAAKIMTQTLTNDILRMTKLDAAGMATDNDRLMLTHAVDVLADLVGLTKNVQRNAARTVSAARMPTGPITGALEAADAEALRKQIGDTSFKFVSNLLSLTDGSPKAVIKLLEPTFGQKAWGVMHEFWVNSVLSRWTTQAVNIAGNVRNTFLFPMYRVAGGVITADRQSIDVGLAQYAAIKNHIFDSAEMARRAFMSNAPILDSKATQLEAKQGWINAGTFGVQDDSIFGVGINWMGKAINTPTRFLTTTDEFFGQLNYRASVEARARVEAVQKNLSTKPDIEVMVNGETHEGIGGRQVREREDGRSLQSADLLGLRRRRYAPQLSSDGRQPPLEVHLSRSSRTRRGSTVVPSVRSCTAQRRPIRSSSTSLFRSRRSRPTSSVRW
jgi:hypothetical protein